MDVVLIDIANDPLTKLYGAYRTCYTPKTPREGWEDIAAGTGGPDKVAQFAAGIPAEDARFVLPNAAPTNFQIMVNFAELLHIGDLRLCTRAQWEIRRMIARMRAELMRKVPELAKYMQPKCGEKRMGYCDED